ncbi:MAG TPA: CapA family protein [Actinomycetota bacterium]|nr:CapA family protein [Actinomycetota bacterium]
MTARHARRSTLPFGAVLVVLAAIAAGAVAFAATAGDEPSTSPRADGGLPSVTPSVSPISSPSVTSSPSPTRSSEPKETIVIHGTGDVSLDPAYIPAFRSNGYGWAWSGLEGLFRRDDLTVINHECPSTDIVDPIPKTYSFRCDPEALDEAVEAGIEVASLANNHGFDQGPDALMDSVRNMERAGIVPLGAGASEEEADAPRYLQVKGWRIGLVGVGEVIDPDYQVAVGDEIGTAVGHDFPRALRAIREAEANADLVVVVIHWGVELDTQPRDYQVVEAERMVAAGADVIFGHHAHRLQPMDVIDGRPVFYGLGNFVWPSFSVDGSTTAVAQVTIRPNGTIKGRLLPAYIVSNGHPVLRSAGA